MRRLLAVLLVMSFLLFSCSEKESPESLYNPGKLKEAIALSDRILSESLDEDALYYKAISYYSLDITGEAEEAATLYLLLYSDGKYRTEALSIIFMTGSDSKALDAGKELMEYDLLGHRGKTRLCLLYALNGDYNSFRSLYETIQGELTASENAYLLIVGRSDTSMILMAIERLLDEGSDYSDIIINRASRLLEKRGEDGMFTEFLSSMNYPPSTSD